MDSKNEPQEKTTGDTASAAIQSVEAWAKSILPSLVPENFKGSAVESTGLASELIHSMEKFAQSLTGLGSASEAASQSSVRASQPPQR